jgi:hypothetical protein
MKRLAFLAALPLLFGVCGHARAGEDGCNYEQHCCFPKPPPVVPEPGSMALMLTGLASSSPLWLRFRRRR